MEADAQAVEGEGAPGERSSDPAVPHDATCPHDWRVIAHALLNSQGGVACSLSAGYRL